MGERVRLEMEKTAITPPWNPTIGYTKDTKTVEILGSIEKTDMVAHQGSILRRRRGVSLFTYIFSISFRGRLEPSGKLTNFQPPPPPRFPFDPSFSTVKFHPSDGRRRLYLWHFTSPANCTQVKHHIIGSVQNRSSEIYDIYSLHGNLQYIAKSLLRRKGQGGQNKE